MSYVLLFPPGVKPRALQVPDYMDSAIWRECKRVQTAAAQSQPYLKRRQIPHLTYSMVGCIHKQYGRDWAISATKARRHITLVEQIREHYNNLGPSATILVAESVGKARTLAAVDAATLDELDELIGD